MRKLALIILIALYCFAPTSSGAGVRFITDTEGNQHKYTAPPPAENIKGCESGGFFSKQPTGMNCKKTSYKGFECYWNCRSGVESCEDMGYISKVPVGKQCIETTVGELTCYRNCSGACPDGAFESEPTGYSCERMFSNGRTCYSKCKRETCENSGLLDMPIKGQNCTTLSYGNLTCYKCSTNEQICESVGYYYNVPVGMKCNKVTQDGVTCYKDCQKPSCKDIGYYDAMQNNMKCYRKVVDDVYSDCYECREYRCSDGGYLDSKPNGVDSTEITYYGNNCYNI